MERLIIDLRYNESASKLSVTPSTRPTKPPAPLRPRSALNSLFRRKQEINKRRSELLALRRRLQGIKREIRQREAQGESIEDLEQNLNDTPSL